MEGFEWEASRIGGWTPAAVLKASGVQVYEKGAHGHSQRLLRMISSPLRIAYGMEPKPQTLNPKSPCAFWVPSPLISRAVLGLDDRASATNGGFLNIGALSDTLASPVCPILQPPTEIFQKNGAAKSRISATSPPTSQSSSHA